jgi:hypothetical protein
MLLTASVALAEPCEPTSSRTIVKSVFVPFALSWLLDRWSPHLALVTRSPWSTVASWRRRGWDPPFFRHPTLGWPDVDRDRLGYLLSGRPLPATPPLTEPVRRLTWELAVLMSVILSAADNADVKAAVVAHEELCRDPVAQFRGLYSQLGLTWTPAAARYLVESDAPGGGMYDTKRVARNEPQRWRDELSDRDVQSIKDVVAGFDIPWR